MVIANRHAQYGCAFRLYYVVVWLKLVPVGVNSVIGLLLISKFLLRAFVQTRMLVIAVHFVGCASPMFWCSLRFGGVSYCLVLWLGSGL